MSLKLKDPNTLKYSSKAMRWEEEEEDMENISDEATDSSLNVMKKKRRPANLCIECPVCGGPAPDHLHFGGQSCYSCRAFFRRTSPRPISSFRCRSGLNNCIINSGSKSCIPCRLTKCIQIGMDPALVRGKKTKSDFENEDFTNHYNDECKPELATIPPLTKIRKSSEDSQESLLKFRADVLNYQGLCLQYEASLLEKQARSMGDIQKDTFYTDYMDSNNNNYGDQKYSNNNSMYNNIKREHIKTDLKSESVYESKYHPPVVDYKKSCDPNVTRYPGSWSSYSENDTLVNSSRHRQSHFTDRERSSVYKPTGEHSNDTTYYQAHQTEWDNNYLERKMFKQDSHLREEDKCEFAGPLDLSIKKATPSPQLHTQVHNMPRIFFRLEQNRI